MCLHCYPHYKALYKVQPTLRRKSAPSVTPTPKPYLSKDPYMIQFIIGKIDGPDSFPRQSVYMLSTLAEKSPYLQARIHAPPLGRDIFEVVLTETYHDAMNLYKIWLQKGVTPKFRPSTTAPVATLKQTFLWRECFDLIRAHITGTRFAHAEFENYVMDELKWWLDPDQEADADILNFVFSERGVSERLQRFVVDRMFAQEEQVRRIFGLFLQRKGECRRGNFTMGKESEYHRQEGGSGSGFQSCEAKDQKSIHRMRVTRTTKHWRPSFYAQGLQHESQTPEKSVSRADSRLSHEDKLLPPLPPPPQIHTGLLEAVSRAKNESDKYSFAEMKEPRTQRSPTPLPDSSRFMHEIYVQKAADDAIMPRSSLKRKPLPPSHFSLVKEQKLETLEESQRRAQYSFPGLEHRTVDGNL